MAALVLVLLGALLYFMHQSLYTPAEAANPPLEVQHVSMTDFTKLVLELQIPVVLQFDATWCPYCKKLQPMLAQFAGDRRGKMAVYKVDIDAEPGLAQLFDVKSLPTLILLKDGSETGRLEGVPNKIRLYAWAQ